MHRQQKDWYNVKEQDEANNLDVKSMWVQEREQRVRLCRGDSPSLGEQVRPASTSLYRDGTSATLDEERTTSDASARMSLARAREGVGMQHRFFM